MTTKRAINSKLITTTQHKLFSAFSKSMVNDSHVNNEIVSTIMYQKGKPVKGVPKKNVVNASGKSKYWNTEMPILVKDASKDSVITTANSNSLKLSNQRASLSDEALLYLVHLSGHHKNMFLFIVFYLVNPETLEFKTDSYVKAKYEEFCKVTGYNVPSKMTIDDSIKRLSEMKLILNVKKNHYLINPILLGYSSNAVRLNAVTIYSQKLFDKGKDVAECLLPELNIKPSRL
jgi:hypothetical protein